MPRDHTRINLDIWGDDDFRDLPVDAQALYWTLWTSPDRTYCGAHEWRPGKLTQCAGDWTVARILSAGAVLSERLFLLIDDMTEECLLRSWIKHDGLWRMPNMAVTMANARAAVGSRKLRGVIVHEVKKLVAAEPDLSGWQRDEVKKMLSQNAINPASLEPFNPGPNGGGNPIDNPSSNPPAKGYDQNGVNPPPNPAPTTATASSTTSYSYKGGYVSPVAHLEPPERCPRHIHIEGWVEEKCGECAALSRAHDAWEDDDLRQRRDAKATAWQALRDCEFCDKDGWFLGDDGEPVEPMVKCVVHLGEVSGA